ncbi:MAG: mycothiol synthase [Actinomycetota bacterium]|nr:mycothiol synthase [Actinomycetota bacterium]
MAHLEVKRQMGQGDIAAVRELLQVASEVDGHAPLGEHQWLDLVHGGREGFAGVVAEEPGHEHPVGYAQVSRERAEVHPTWAVEFVVDPHHRHAITDIGQALLEAALAVVREGGGGHVHLWVPKPTEMHDRITEAVGLRRGRELFQMRRSLPIDVDHPPLDVRPFRPGIDEQAWLEVNNRAFRWHPEQGGWDLTTIRAREEQPWFDADGFLLHERDGRLAGFCWTKVHPDQHPDNASRSDSAARALGEIYVVAVDPDYQGLGLGKALTLAGLDWLAERGLQTAMLYVDAENTAALQLYEKLGFTVDHVDRAYVADL